MARFLSAADFGCAKALKSWSDEAISIQRFKELPAFAKSTTRHAWGKRLVAQFDVPVREVDEVLPEIVLRGRKCDMHERPPLRSLRFANQAHVRFARKTVAFARIAPDTGANHVLPRGRSSTITRHDVTGGWRRSTIWTRRSRSISSRSFANGIEGISAASTLSD